MRLAATVIATLLASASVSALTQTARYTSFAGFGGTYCGSWADARAKKQSIAMEFWVLGYVSGANAFRTEGKNDFLKDVAADAMWGWLDNYCRSQPRELFAIAVNKLAVELETRSH